jgi:hypothetical protein
MQQDWMYTFAFYHAALSQYSQLEVDYDFENLQKLECCQSRPAVVSLASGTCAVIDYWW